MRTIRTYSEMLLQGDFQQRLRYLMLQGQVGSDTFGFDRYMNQMFYNSAEWKTVRQRVIVRDNGCDLADRQRTIFGKVLVHHMNPLQPDDIKLSSDFLMNPQYLVCVSHQTHNMIHYGIKQKLEPSSDRCPNDTCPWKP